MRPLLDAAQMRAFDRHAIDSGVSGQILMENAGRGAAHLIGLKVRPRSVGQAPRTGSSVVGSCVRCADERSLLGARVLILAGPGNNGGDGYVVARHLAARAAQVTVLMHQGAERLRGDARLAFLAMEAVGVRGRSLYEVDLSQELAAADVVVDALLGTGSDREVSGPLRSVIETTNASGAYVIALDVPSGLDASSGAVLGEAIRAAHTVTFAHLKRGLLTTAGHERAGNLTLSHIGIPSSLPASISPSGFLLEESDARARLRPRSVTAHKGNAGRVVILAGSPGTLGAARLCSRAALRAGAGLVTLCNTQPVIEKLESEVAEVMTHAFELGGPGQREEALFSRADALVVGPGWGRSAEAQRAVTLALDSARPCVVDADALHFFSSDQGRALWRSKGWGPWAVLTPHPAEAAALLGTTVDLVEADRFSAASELSSSFDATVLLKGSRPLLCTPGRAPVVSAFGSPALATGGSGDVLCGILAAQLVGATDRGSLFDALMVAVVLQGQAAELWSAENGERGLLASEVGDLVPRVIAGWGSD